MGYVVFHLLCDIDLASKSPFHLKIILKTPYNLLILRLYGLIWVDRKTGYLETGCRGQFCHA
jgi:hypothetical protein